MDWVLVEIPLDEMRWPEVFFSAFIEEPFDALTGVGEFDPLPIQGIALEGSARSDYVASPVIAFPFSDEPILATVTEEKKYFSLLVDMRAFEADARVVIGLYGYVEVYFIEGGFGEDGPFNGTIFSATWYGSITQDFRDLDGTVWTPAAWQGAPEILFINEAYELGDFGHTKLLSSFPELGGIPYEYLGLGAGDRNIKATFTTNSGVPPFNWGGHGNYATADWVTFIGEHPSSATPLDDPNEWIFRVPTLEYDGTIQSVTTTIEWGPEISKTKTVNCSIVNFGSGTNPLVTEVPLGPFLDEAQDCTVQSLYQVQYFVPRWRFANARVAPIRIGSLTGVDLWDEQVRHNYNGPTLHSFTWETANYPDRVEMAEIAVAVIPAAEIFVSDGFPANHFLHPRIGTITIDRGTGAVSFDEEAPTDGTPDGDGPPGDGTAPGRTENPHLRVWTFTLDGHDNYVLRLGDTLTLVFDTYSEQWMDWTDYDSLTWRAQCGLNWIGAEALANTYGSNVVAGDDTYGLLWFLDPAQPFDDDPLGVDGPSYFPRVTVGQVPMRGRENLPCYASWITTDMGAPAYSGAAVTLWTSDDAGATWDNQGYIRVTLDENYPELSWYSLGQIEAPGRLFKIFDDGAVTRIDGLEMNDPDDEK